MSRIKLCHIIVGLNQGGAETVLYNLLLNLDPMCYEVSVISFLGPGFYSKKIEDLGISVYHYKMNTRNVFLNFFEILKKIRKIKPDLVQTWMHHANFIGGLAARLAGVKCVVWNIRDFGDYHKMQTRMIVKLNEKLSYFIPRAIVYCIEREGKHRNDHTKQIYIPNGYDLQVFKPQNKNVLREKLHLPNDKVIIGGLGRNHVMKDFINFIDAAERIMQERPEVNFVLCGKNVELLSEYVKTKKLEGFFYLLPSTSYPQDYLASLDFFVLSSNSEAFPNVVAEAMACGVPCVVTDVGDAAHIVGGKQWLVPVSNSQALAVACLDILSLSKNEYERLGAQVRERIKMHFSLERMVDAYDTLYRQLLGEQRCAE